MFQWAKQAFIDTVTSNGARVRKELLTELTTAANCCSLIATSACIYSCIIGLDDDDCENFLVGDEGLSVAVNESRM